MIVLYTPITSYTINVHITMFIIRPFAIIVLNAFIIFPLRYLSFLKISFFISYCNNSMSPFFSDFKNRNWFYRIPMEC